MPKRILVVADERRVLRLMQVNLLRQGWEVLTARTILEAFEVARSEQPDHIFVDFWCGGLEERLKQDSTTRGIGITILPRRKW